MKWSTMVKLRESSNIIKKATDFGFDPPALKEALEHAQEMLTDDEPPNIKRKVKYIIDKLNFGEVMMLISWLFEPDNVDPDSLISEIAGPYELWAEMWLDEESGRIADGLLREAQALYDKTIDYKGIHVRGEKSTYEKAQADFELKLKEIENLTGQKVEPNEDGVLKFV